MKVLLVSNSGTERCGVAQYGRHLWAAARAAGITMRSWHSTPGYPLPMDAGDYDIIHINYHPATLGFLQEEDLPDGPKKSIFIHDPSAECKLIPAVDLTMSTETALNPASGEPRQFGLLPPPCPDYQPQSTWDGLEWTLGASGIRRDGFDWIEGVVKRQWVEVEEEGEWWGPGVWNPNAWRFYPSAKDPDGWLSDEGEIERLAGCALNIFHYHTANGGQSYAVGLGLTARRPLLLNHNRMLEHIWAHPGAEDEVYLVEDLAEGIHQVIRDLRDGKEKRPFKLANERSWGRAIRVVGGWWEELLTS